MYVVKGQLEDRDHIIGYYEGSYEDIDSYVNFHYGNKYYSISIEELKPQYVPTGFSKNVIELLLDKRDLELQLQQINNLIVLKKG